MDDSTHAADSASQVFSIVIRPPPVPTVSANAPTGSGSDGNASTSVITQTVKDQNTQEGEQYSGRLRAELAINAMNTSSNATSYQNRDHRPNDQRIQFHRRRLAANRRWLATKKEIDRFFRSFQSFCDENSGLMEEKHACIDRQAAFRIQLMRTLQQRFERQYEANAGTRPNHRTGDTRQLNLDMVDIVKKHAREQDKIDAINAKRARLGADWGREASSQMDTVMNLVAQISRVVAQPAPPNEGSD